ncbi:MAG: hypothetical protein GY822_08060 [Deltaproteobacteria bacterium]|nr:hypothetical protein [Deltaproteobacteria bacterium]
MSVFLSNSASEPAHRKAKNAFRSSLSLSKTGRRFLPVVRLFLMTGALFFLSACPSYTLLSEVQQRSLREKFEGQLLWLTQSMYVGEFYDDDRFQLLFPRSFDEIPYLRNLDGETISPPPSDGILPVGTRVRIERVTFPTGQEVFKRPIFTPRYVTWVKLRVAAGRGDTSLMKEAPHILLVPVSLSTEERFSSWLDRALAEQDPNPWLSALSPEIRAGVLEKKPVLGMRSKALEAAMGPFDRKSSASIELDGKERRAEVALWGKIRVTLVDDVVVDIAPHADGKMDKKEPASKDETPGNAKDLVAPIDPLAKSEEATAGTEATTAEETTAPPPTEAIAEEEALEDAKKVNQPQTTE